MSFGIENNILYPPWSLIISLLIINGLYYFGFNISKLIFKNTKYLKINLALSIPLSFAFLSLLIFPMALLGILEKIVLQSISIIFIIYGLHKFFINKKLLFNNLKLIFGFRFKKFSFSKMIEILLLATFFLLSCSPITDADSINYHVAVSLNILNFGIFPTNLEWFHSKLSGSGEVINALALSVGAEQFGSLIQFFSIASINIIFKFSNYKKRKIIQICSLLFLSSPVLVALVSSHKPMLIGISMVFLSGFLVINFLEDKNFSHKNKLKIFGITTLLLLTASTIKLNFILSSLIIGIYSFFIMMKSRIIFRSFFLGFFLFLIVFFPFTIWKTYYFGGNVFLNIFEVFPGNYPATEEFYNQLKNWRDNESFFPLNLIFTSNLSLITTVLGVGTILLILPTLKIQNYKSFKFKIFVFLSLSISLLLYFLSQKNSRFFLEVYLLLTMSLLYLNINNNRQIINISKYLLYPQCIATLLITTYGIMFISIGSINYELRQNVMMSKAHGYQISKWLDKIFPKNSTFINALGQYASLMPRNSISNDWHSYTKTNKEIEYYYDVVRAKKPKYIVISSNSSIQNNLSIIKDCKVEIFEGPKLFINNYRNPFNKNKKGFYVWVFEVLDLENCKW